MGNFRDNFRAMLPEYLLAQFRKYKKFRHNRKLQSMRKRGEVVKVDEIVEVLRQQGIQIGDSVLVHCAMSKIGPLEKGPKTLVDALITVVGKTGNILMPTSPNPAMQLDYIKNLEVFDVENSPSKMGAVTEYFRQLPGVERSWSPTEPVSVLGPDAKWFTEGHVYKPTPYDADSPFARLAQKGGKILYIGVTLINAGTSLHLLEDAVEDFPLPVYFPEKFPVRVKSPDGKVHAWEISVHNPEVSKTRKCDDLLPLFQSKGVAQAFKLGLAPSWIFDARGMFEVMMEAYSESGVTMYGIVK
ncbi:MAG: AAC(3) family N-acetyltransferase [Cryomorphaceae bacterium]|nr:AAC(3) family N-acetyltransferase [Cryomorphaceae bacterium]